MLRKVIGGGACLLVSGFYFVANQFVTDEIVGSFEHNGEAYDLYVDRHPDGTVFLSLWDDEGQTAYAVSEWFRASDDLSFSCEDIQQCIVVRKVDAKNGQVSGLQLMPDSVDEPISSEQYYSENTHGFEKYQQAIATEELTATNSPAKTTTSNHTVNVPVDDEVQPVANIVVSDLRD